MENCHANVAKSGHTHVESLLGFMVWSTNVKFVLQNLSKIFEKKKNNCHFDGQETRAMMNILSECP